MQDWLTHMLSQAHRNLSEEAEGFVLGRGLPSAYLKDMGIGIWEEHPDTRAPDETFRKVHGHHGQYRRGWLSIPLVSPRGKAVGVVFRRWDGTKEMRDFRLPETAWIPVFEGMNEVAFQKIWDGGSVWLVEGVFDMALAHVVPAGDVVLSCGTARVSRNQLNFLHRFLRPQSTVYVVFDEDETGRKQVTGYKDPQGKKVTGVLDRLRRVGLRCQDVRYTGGKDPGEIWENGGARLLQSQFRLGERYGR
jgi:hypothetical protein